MQKIVFDVDDTLWGLNANISKKLHIPSEKLTIFSAMDNQNLTMTERKALLNAYADAKSFENIEWYDGIERILQLEKYGVEIHINSNSATNEIIKLKREQLQQVLTLYDDRLHFNLISMKKATKKELDNDTFILIDDSPHNIALSNAKYNIMPMHPWNTSAEGKKSLCGKTPLYYDNLNKIIDAIKQIILTERS